MKPNRLGKFALAFALFGLAVSISMAAPFGTAFTYQGRLTAGTNVNSGLYDFRFSLWDGAGSGANLIGTTQAVSGVSISNGFFTVTLDFGTGAFTGDGRWLELAVRTNGAITFGVLNPRQPLTPTPYAIAASNLSGTLPAAQITGTLPDAALSGTYASAVIFNNPANVFAGNGGGLTNINASTLGGFGFCNLPCYWNLVGNAGTTPGVNFLGTTDNKALEIKVNSQRAFRLEPNATSPNIVGGYSGNSTAAGIFGATIAGGGASGEPNTLEVSLSSIGGGSGNRISPGSPYSVIAGGHDNLIYTNMQGATISGGGFNTIFAGDYSGILGGVSNVISVPGSPFTDESIFHYANTIVGGSSNQIYHARYSVIAGGLNNSMVGDHGDEPVYAAIVGGAQNQIYALGDSDYGAAIVGGLSNVLWSARATILGGGGNYIGRLCWGSTIGGGVNNSIVINAQDSSIGGGDYNQIQPTAFHSVIAGGQSNLVLQGAFFGSDWGGYATIPGGRNNTATNFAFAAGCRAKAIHQGAFVWADDNEFDFPSTNANSFSVRAVGGTRFVSAINGSGNPSAGVVLQPGSGSWTTLSDRDSKDNLKRVNRREVLEQLDAIPIATWNYRAQDKSIRHIGPMAQDFAAAFKVGEDDHGISTVDADGVALAAIQGLHEALKEKDSRIESLEKDVADLKALVKTLVNKSAGDFK
jgi:hypothetical protein